MKEILIALSVITLSTSSSANEGHNFYFKVNAGANKMRNAKQKLEDMNMKSTKSKSEISPTFGIGAGYYINDMIRTDLTFDYSKVSFKKGQTNFNMPGDNAGKIITGQLLLKRNASIYSLMISGYIDIPTTENFSIFVGAGVGVAQIREKLHGILAGVVLDGDTVIGAGNEKDSKRSKNKNNFAYSLTIGSTLKVASNVNIDFSYRWQDFGSSTYKKDKDGDTLTSNRYNGHSGTAGLRFSL